MRVRVVASYCCAARCTMVVLPLPLPMLSHHIVAARCTSVVLLLPLLMLSHHIVATRCTSVVLLLSLPMLSHHILLLLDASAAKSQGWYPFQLKLGCFDSKQKYDKAIKNTPQVLLDSTLLHIIHLHMNKNRAQYKQKM